MRSAEEMDQADVELRDTILKVQVNIVICFKPCKKKYIFFFLT